MPALRIVTLTGEDFDRACGELLRLAAQSYPPTLLVGIRTGGLVAAEAMARVVPDAPPVMPLTCRRAGTQAKARVPLLGRALSALPRPLADGLRKAEFSLTAGRRRARNPPQAPDQAEADAIAARTFPGAARLLVVDDAVDSGVTLAAVLAALRRYCAPSTQIRSAVITQTLENPVIAPDYRLHRSVLCRFPWSLDAAA